MQKKSKNASDLEILAALPVQVEVLFLKDHFSDYKNPIKKIFDLKQKGYLFLVKRGHYLNLKSQDCKTVKLEHLANMLYFPSYVSGAWALQYHGLLMERVYTVTSVTTRRSAKFKTPMGIFSFEHLYQRRYPHGYVMETFDDQNFFIARPHKALLDMIHFRVKKVRWTSKKEIEEFLVEDLRLNLEMFLSMVRPEELTELMPFYHRNSKEARILKWLKMKQRGKYA